MSPFFLVAFHHFLYYYISETVEKMNRKTILIYILVITIAGSTLPYLHSSIWQEPPKYTGETGNFVFHNADLLDVIFFFSKVYNFDVVVAPGISGQVSIRLINVPWDQALDTILKQHGLFMIRENNESTAVINASGGLPFREKVGPKASGSKRFADSNTKQ